MPWDSVDPPRDEDGPRFTERDFERYERNADRARAVKHVIVAPRKCVPLLPSRRTRGGES